MQTEADLLRQAADLLAGYRTWVYDITRPAVKPDPDETRDTIAALRVLAATKETTK